VQSGKSYTPLNAGLRACAAHPSWRTCCGGPGPFNEEAKVGGGRLPRRRRWRRWRDAGDGGLDAVRHEAADAAAWPRWRRRSKPRNLGFRGGGIGVLGFGGEGRRRRRRGGCRKRGKSLEPAAADLREQSILSGGRRRCGWAVAHSLSPACGVCGVSSYHRFKRCRGPPPCSHG
jgi:hypothetical protein